MTRWINAHLRSTRESRDRVHLQRVEQVRLRAQGLDETTARRQAELVAAALVNHATEVRRSGELPVATAGASLPTTVAEKRARMKAMLAEARSGKHSRKSSIPWIVRGRLGFILSAKVRFLLGGLLIVGCGLRVKQNRVVSVSEIRNAAAQAVQHGSVADVPHEWVSETGRPLELPFVGWIFDSFNPGLAEVLLVVSSLFRGWKMSLFMLPAAAIIVLGPKLGIPGIDTLGGAHATGIVIGLVVAGAGLILGRSSGDDN